MAAAADQVLLGQRIGHVDVRAEDLPGGNVQQLQAAEAVRDPGEVLIDPAQLQDEGRLEDGGAGVLKEKEGRGRFCLLWRNRTEDRSLPGQ